VQVHKDKKLLNINRLFLINTLLLIAFYCIFLCFKEHIPAFLLLSLSFVVVFDVFCDFMFSNIIKESWYIKYIEYYRKLFFLIIVSSALVVDTDRLKISFSTRSLFVISLVFLISLIYFIIAHKYFGDYKRYVNKKAQTHRYLHYIDSIFWLSLFCLLQLSNLFLLYIFIIRYISVFLLDIFRSRKKVSKKSFVGYIKGINRFTPIAVFFALIYNPNIQYYSFLELTGVFFLFFIIKIIGVKQPQQIFSERIYTDKEKEEAIKSKYHKKGFPRQYPGAINSYLMKVVSTGARYFTCRVGSKNTEEILPVLNIPNETKKEIRNTVRKGKVVFISEAAFDPKWVWDAKYLIWDEKKEMLYEKGEKGINIADKVAPVLKWKNRVKSYNNTSFALTPEGIKKLREYSINVRKTDVSSNIYRVDVDNYNELLPLLKIPTHAKKEIADLIRSNKNNTVIVSRAAYNSKWKHSKKYLVFELNEKDRKILKSFFKREKIKMRYQYSRFFQPLFAPDRFPRSFKKEIFKYKKRLKKIPLGQRFDMVIIDKENMEELFPALYIPGKVKDEIEGLVNNGKVVIVSESAFQPEWKWEEKYLVFDESK